MLLEAFIRTANLYPGSAEELEKCWSIAVRMAEEGSLAYNPPLMRDYIAAKRSKQFPAVHHSDAYTVAYRPAYRVVAQSFLPPGLKP